MDAYTYVKYDLVVTIHMVGRSSGVWSSPKCIEQVVLGLLISEGFRRVYGDAGALLDMGFVFGHSQRFQQQIETWINVLRNWLALQVPAGKCLYVTASAAACFTEACNAQQFTHCIRSSSLVVCKKIHYIVIFFLYEHDEKMTGEATCFEPPKHFKS